MATKEYQEALSELLNILENTDEELVKKIPSELILFWEKNKSEEYVPELDHDLTLEEMKLKTKTRQLIAMIYINYLCDPKKKRDIKKAIKEINEENSSDINFNKDKEDEEDKKKVIKTEKEFEKIKEDVYLIEEKKINFFKKIFDRIRSFFIREKNG